MALIFYTCILIFFIFQNDYAVRNAAYTQRCAVDNWQCPTGNAPSPPEVEIPRPFSRPSVPSTRTPEVKQAFAEQMKKLMDDFKKKKKQQEEEKDAEEAVAKAEAWQRIQVKSREEAKSRAAIAYVAAELAANNY